MKSKLFLIVFFCLLFSCNKQELKDGQNLNLTDVNKLATGNNVLNASWTQTTDITIYTRNNNLITVPLTVSYPWYSAGNPLAVANPDIQPNDGWELVYDDLGTAAKGVDFPFFALYNKYRGILRLFLYNSQRVSANYFRGELYFRESSFSNSILSYVGDEAKSTRATYDPAEKQTVIAYANAYSSWINFDFTVANYDDRINKNNVLDFKMYSINESNISLSSTEFTLAHELASKAQLGTSSSSFSSDLKTGQKYAKTFDDTQKLLKEAVNSMGRESLQKTVSNILKTPYVQAIPMFGQALGIIGSFIGGGGSQPFQWQMLKFNGSLKLEGTFTSTAPVYTLSLATSNDIPTGTVIKKLNSTNFGVFNLQDNPELVVVKDEEQWYEGANPDWSMADRDYSRYTDLKLKNGDGDLLLNPTSGLVLISKKVRLIAESDYNGTGTQYLNENFFDWNQNVIFDARYLKNDVWDGYNYPIVDPQKLGVQLIFRPVGVSDNSKDVLFLKVYKIK